MSETLVDVSPPMKEPDESGGPLGSPPSGENLAAIQRLVQQARDWDRCVLIIVAP